MWAEIGYLVLTIHFLSDSKGSEDYEEKKIEEDS